MASDDTPREGESPSGIDYSTERELQTLLSGQTDLLRDLAAEAAREEELEETERKLRRLSSEAGFLADVIDAMSERGD
jgi:hypothetical protein